VARSVGSREQGVEDRLNRRQAPAVKQRNGAGRPEKSQVDRKGDTGEPGRPFWGAWATSPADLQRRRWIPGQGRGAGSAIGGGEELVPRARGSWAGAAGRLVWPVSWNEAALAGGGDAGLADGRLSSTGF
jgi:hypothetical protein